MSFNEVLRIAEKLGIVADMKWLNLVKKSVMLSMLNSVKFIQDIKIKCKISNEKIPY